MIGRVVAGRVVVGRIVRIERDVADVAASTRFYCEHLGFRLDAAPGVAHEGVERAGLVRGGQRLVLVRRVAPGVAAWAAANDAWFQHLALPAADVGRAVAALPPGTVAISRGGPQRLPAGSGGVTAFKFRDPDGHPLELIAFPDGARAGDARAGIDHSAIVVADAARSIAFYRDTLGFVVTARGRNVGPAQDRLDGLAGADVEVIALAPALAGTPHLELLAYRSPAVRRAPEGMVGATRLVLAVAGLAQPAVRRDPDGHGLVLVGE